MQQNRTRKERAVMERCYWVKTIGKKCSKENKKMGERARRREREEQILGNQKIQIDRKN